MLRNDGSSQLVSKYTSTYMNLPQTNVKLKIVFRFSGAVFADYGNSILMFLDFQQAFADYGNSISTKTVLAYWCYTNR